MFASNVTSSSVAVNDNKTLASVLGNKATNRVNVAVTDLTQANTGLAIACALGVTFPFNLLIGIPLYLKLAPYFA
jgi:hypothetical protein